MPHSTQDRKPLARTVWALLPWLFLLAILALLVNLGHNISEKKKQLVSEKENTAPLTSPPTNIVVQEIVPGPMEDSIDLPAITEAWHDLTIKSEVSGKIISLAVQEGSFINKGDTIGQIDASVYKNRYEAIWAKHQLAQSNFNRLEKLKNQSAVAKSQLDVALATLNELKALLADAKLQIERCTITAPISGFINALPTRVGELLAYADPIVQIVDISIIKVNVAIPESDISAINNLQHCIVVFSALDNKEFIATKYFAAKQPSSAAMTYNLQLVLENPSGEILPGMFARAKVVKASYDSAIGIPLYAILSEADEHFVYVIEDNKALKRHVTTGFMESWNIQITSGLKEKELVAIVGHRGLESGQPVQIIKTVQNPQEITP